MNIYSTLKNILKSSVTYDFEDKVIDTIVRVAQNNDKVRVNGEILQLVDRLMRENELLKKNNSKLFLENNQMKGNLLNLEGNQIPSRMKIQDSYTTEGVTDVVTNDPVSVKRQNNMEFNKGVVDENGVTLQAPGN